MDPESAPATTPADGQEPESVTGQEPSAEPTPKPEDKPEGKRFDEAFVKQLRKEAAASRTELVAVKSELDKLKDRDKSNHERLTERVAESERRASAAETRLIRYEVVADRKLPLDAAGRLAGETREEIEANADWLAEQLAEQQKKSSGFDGGARTTPPETKPPEQAHNDLLLRALGRPPTP